jgi:hypothetical protein
MGVIWKKRVALREVLREVNSRVMRVPVYKPVDLGEP